jgi:ATP-dependent DNA helicase RecG
LKTLKDILYYFPQRYAEVRESEKYFKFSSRRNGFGIRQSHRSRTQKRFSFKNSHGQRNARRCHRQLQVVWFHQPYIAKMLQEGAYARFTGKVSQSKKGFLYISNPEFDVTDTPPKVAGSSLFGESHEEGAMMPVYSETQGITSKWMYHTIQKIFASKILETLVDPIPDEILKKYNLPGIQTALIWIHSPRKLTDAEAARKRFAFEEVFFIQLQKQRDVLL